MMYKFQLIFHWENIVLLSERTVCERCVGMWSLFVVRILRKTWVYSVRQFRVLLLLELPPRIDPSCSPRMIDEWIWSIVEMVTGREISKYSGNSHPCVILPTTYPKRTLCMWSLTSLKKKFIIIILISLRVLFPPGTSPLKPVVNSELRRQVSECSTFRIVCDVTGSCLV
jgi:hypothetical protein